MTHSVDSGNIRLFGYSQGFHGEGALNDSGVIKNVDFQDFRMLRLRHLRKWGQHYYIVSNPTCNQWTLAWRQPSDVRRTERHGDNSWQRLRPWQAPEEPLVAFPCTDPKIHDLEWPFYVQLLIFTITSRVSAIRLHTYRRAIYIKFLCDVTSEDMRNRTVKLRSAEHYGFAKGLRIFRRRKVAGDTSSKR